MTDMGMSAPDFAIGLYPPSPGMTEGALPSAQAAGVRSQIVALVGGLLGCEPGVAGGWEAVR